MKKKIILFLSFLLTAVFLIGCSETTNMRIRTTSYLDRTSDIDVVSETSEEQAKLIEISIVFAVVALIFFVIFLIILFFAVLYFIYFLLKRICEKGKK